MGRKRSASKTPSAVASRVPIPDTAPAASLLTKMSRLLPGVLLACALAAVAVTRSLPYFSAAQAARADLRFEANGKQYPYLIGQDSYSWVRKARNYLANGSPCDAKVGDDCRDLLRHAPVGSSMPYSESPHPLVIAWLHRILSVVDPNRPLEASAFWVQVVVGTLGVIPAWFIGRRLAGIWGGFFAAILVGLNENFLERSLGADNDVWNVVLPLFAAWAVLTATASHQLWRRLGAAAAAAVVVVLHSTLWNGWIFSFVVMLGGLLACGAWVAARMWVASERKAVLTHLGALALTTICFVTVTWGFTHEQTEWDMVFSALPRPFVEATSPPTTSPQPAPPAPASPQANTEFPDGLRNIGELRVLSFPEIAPRLGGRLMLFGSLVGLLLLAAPHGDRRRFTSIVLAAGAVLIGAAIWSDSPPRALILCTAVPLLLLLAWHIVQRRREPASSVPGSLLLAIWLAASLYQSLIGGQRYMLLAVAPIGLAFAAGAGCVVQRLQRDRSQPAAVWSAVAGFTILVGSIAQQGFIYANHALPKLNDAWSDALSELRAKSPKDAIINAWWPYGYWIEYHADRGVAADGSSVRKRIPHWTGRALLAEDEREAVGLLRMLNCGSDTAPEAEGSASAYERLLAAGANGFVAHDIVIDLASLDRVAADTYLQQRGYGEATRNGILAATHCTPRPAYLMLSDKQARQEDVRYQGTWDIRRAAIASQLRWQPEADAVATMVNQLGFAEPRARSLYNAARSLRSDAERDNFIAPSSPYLTGWLACGGDASGRHSCMANRQLSPQLMLEGFSYTNAAPEDGTLRFREGDHMAERSPESIVLADAYGVRAAEISGSTAAGYAVLLDVAANRAMIGPPYMIRSLLTRLEFLDQQPLQYFQKVDEHRAANERVSTWRIHWPQ